MGMSQNNSTLVAPQPKGIIDPATGKPVGSNDAYFTEINDELADKGFLVTSTDELITWARAHGMVRVVLAPSEMSVPLYDSLGFRPAHDLLRLDLGPEEAP